MLENCQRWMIPYYKMFYLDQLIRVYNNTNNKSKKNDNNKIILPPKLEKTKNR